MKRRLITIAVAAAALASAGTAASASPLGATTASTWGCVVLKPADLSVCMRNPLPERLPDVPEVPTPATPV